MKNKYFNFWFGGSRPIFMYAPLETELVKLNFRKGENNGIDLTSDINANSLKKLGIGWTMLFGFNIEKLNNDKDFSAIFSHSNNGCFQFIINDLKDKVKIHHSNLEKQEHQEIVTHFILNLFLKKILCNILH